MVVTVGPCSLSRLYSYLDLFEFLEEAYLVYLIKI